MTLYVSETMDSKKVNTVKVHKIENLKLEAGSKRPDLPTYRADEVSKHDTKLVNNFFLVPQLP